MTDKNINFGDYFLDEWNIIPIPKGSKVPKINWKKYQTERYSREELLKHDDGNYAVICGKISDNLIGIDLDFSKSKRGFEQIFKEFSEFFRVDGLANTYIAETPHGIHLYYKGKDFSVNRQLNKNIISQTFKKGVNKGKTIFVGTIKTTYSSELDGVDILGNEGYGIISPSKIYDEKRKKILQYRPLTDISKLKTITKKDFERIKSFFILKKEKSMRQGFIDILNGNIEIESYGLKHKLKQKEHVYWHRLYCEAWNVCGLLPEELFPFLKNNQPAFDERKTRTQLKHHKYTDPPMTYETYNKYFPTMQKMYKKKQLYIPLLSKQLEESKPIKKYKKLSFKELKNKIENIDENSESVQEEITNQILIFIDPKDTILYDRIITEIKGKFKFISKPAIKKIYLNLIKRRNEEKKKEKNIIDSEGIMSIAEKQECEDWLNSPDKNRYDLIFKILDFLVVGEEKNKKLLFFLKFGDLSPDLMSQVGYKGESSSGKSFVTDEVLKIIPSFVIYRLDGASDKSLQYDAELHEKIRIIYIRELVMDSPIIDLLKTMHDYNPILKTVEKEDEHFVTRTIRMQKTGLIMTFSFEKIPKDLQNRIWMITPDQSYTQTKAIIKRRLLQEKDIIKYDLQKEVALNKINFIQKSLMLLDFTLKPYIAYADQLKPMFSEKKIRIRRDIKKFIDLIKIITLFNQRNRKVLNVRDKKYVFSEFEDLRLAIEIGMEYFIKTSLDIDDIKKDVLDYMEIDAEDPYSFKEIYNKLEEKTTIQPNQIRYKLNGLEQDGYISIDRQGRGKPSLYKKIKHYEIKKDEYTEMKKEIDKIVRDKIEFYVNYIEKYGLKSSNIKNGVESK